MTRAVQNDATRRAFVTSLAKRARKESVPASSGRMTLMATFCPAVLSARKTAPIPPSPSFPRTR
ncbi:hypothetical protein BJF79_43750 [Actinomadura sp. CNU-125]|nr:hypothetical protein BJF79_43750 [Actinomadura sp. CNU-125]